MPVTDATWAERFMAGAFTDPAGRISGLGYENRSVGGEHVSVVTLRFTAEDMRGEAYEATAEIFLPAVLAERPSERAPVWFNCGYELADEAAAERARQGWIVVTPCEPAPGEVFPGANPLVRGPNTEFVLAHLVRGLAFADPAAIVYSGGSAGGSSALLVAAEAFPAAAAVPAVPVVNLAYQGAYLFATLPLLTSDPPPDHPAVPALLQVTVSIAEGWRLAYGEDLSGPGWWEHSPVAHVPRITCRVAAVFSSADFLIPLEQVGAGLVPDAPAGLEFGAARAAADLTDAEHARIRLLDVLGDGADVQVLPVPAGAPAMEDLDLTRPVTETPVPVPDVPTGGKRWLVAVVDEGPALLGGHWRHALAPDFEPFAARAIADGIGVVQLTRAKLDQLLDRYRGVEWLAPGFRHLDRPPAEQLDVERGLRAYCALSPAHARRFADLYPESDAERRVLPDGLVRDLLGLLH
ncbi:hypothetical protein [Actinomadura montaniterrae]|uniref:Uncharacterized protein n=1 Tax=Actinomadura montaniterrae TaxID=1803903 RepID=A0A6L3VVL9_9ACTN|nr:hypothetical protein [Actinomadura montaniterrae]KAB2378923.1 hypothetical protein F9B16_22790 [Actinomadura montaniterrae]